MTRAHVGDRDRECFKRQLEGIPLARCVSCDMYAHAIGFFDRSRFVDAIRRDAATCRRLGEFNNARLCEEVAHAVEQETDSRPLGQLFRGLERDP